MADVIKLSSVGTSTFYGINWKKQINQVYACILELFSAYRKHVFSWTDKVALSHHDDSYKKSQT